MAKRKPESVGVHVNHGVTLPPAGPRGDIYLKERIENMKRYSVIT